MAIFALAGRWHVIGRFSSSFGAIVTADTTCRDAIMVEMGARKGRRGVTVFAIIARGWVIDGFPQRLATVMACDAALRNAAMVKAGDRPLPCGVARVARGLRDDMVGRLAIGARVIVARRAFLWRSLENTANMAAFAFR